MAALSQIESSLKAGILDGVKEWTPAAGTLPGKALSPRLSNNSLNPLDLLLAQQ